MAKHRRTFLRISESLGSVLLAVAILQPTAGMDGVEPNVDLQLEQTFDGLFQADASTLGPDQRLVPARRYAPADDGSHEAYAIVDTAGAETLKTERYRAVFRQEGSKKWTLAEKQLEESAERLFREDVEAKQFFGFETFRLEREGLTVSASNGTALAYHRQGKISRFVLAAPDLAYEYVPPANLGTYRARYSAMKNTWTEKYVFEPAVAQIVCDPSSCEAALSSFVNLKEVDRASIGDALARFHDEAASTARKERKEDPFSGFSLPSRAGSRRFEVSARAANDDQWVALQQDSDSGHEVRFLSKEHGKVFGYPSEASRRSADPLAIERRDDEDGYLFQVEGLMGEVAVGVLEPELLQADIEFTIEAKRDLDAIPFSLTALMFQGSSEASATLHINGIEDGQGRRLSWVRRGIADGVVLLPETVPAGSTTVIRMQFQTKGSVLKVNASYSYMSRSGWLPFVRYTDSIADFDLTVHVPSRYTALTVGARVSEKQTGKTKVSRWVAQSPVRFPTIIFGSYQEDRPKTKATKSDGTVIPVAVYVDKTAMSQWGIRAGQLRPPGEIAVNALNVYRELFGVDYPYSKLDLVNDPLDALGAQSPASMVYLGSAIFRSQATLAEAIDRDTTTLVEERIAHEVAHQWWGALIGCANQRNYWFIESLAEYSSALFMEILASEGFQKPEKGQKAYRSMVKRWRDETLRSKLLGSVQDADSLWTNGGRIPAIYSRGPYVFHILRQTFGDQKFFGFLKELAQELSGKEIVTREIQDVAERTFGGIGPDGKPYRVDLEWFFDQWVRDVGIPQYHVEVEHQPTEDGKFAVRGVIHQRVFVGRHDLELSQVYYRGVVPVTVKGKDKQEYSANVVVEGPQTPFAFKVPVKPIDIQVNKYGAILARPDSGG